MLKQIEFWLARNLKQGRMMLSFALIIALISINALVYSSWIDMDRANAQKNMRELQRTLETIKEKPAAVSQTYLNLVLPKPFSRFFADNNFDQLPTERNVSIVEAALPQRESSNYLQVLKYTPIDLQFVFSTVLGFLAVAMAFDNISGEKEKGTLKLLLSYSVPRWQIYTSKLIATTLSLIIPMVMGLVIHATVMLSFAGLHLSSELISMYLLFTLASCLMILFYVVMATAISAMVDNSIISLIISLTLWVAIVVVIPGIANFAGKASTDIASSAEFEKESSDNFMSVLRRVAQEGLFATSNSQDGSDPFSRQRTADKYFEEYYQWKNAAVQDFINNAARQPETETQINLFSPAGVYVQVSRKIAGSGVANLIDFYNQAALYASQLKTLFQQHDDRDPKSAHTLYFATVSKSSLTTEPIESRMPAFEYEEPPATERFLEAGMNILLQLLYVAFFYLFGLRAINVYDVR